MSSFGIRSLLWSVLAATAASTAWAGGKTSKIPVEFSYSVTECRGSAWCTLNEMATKRDEISVKFETAEELGEHEVQGQYGGVSPTVELPLANGNKAKFFASFMQYEKARSGEVSLIGTIANESKQIECTANTSAAASLSMRRKADVGVFVMCQVESDVKLVLYLQLNVPKKGRF